MDLPPDSLEQVKGLEDNLLYSTQGALAEVAVISPLRINRELVMIISLLSGLLYALPLLLCISSLPCTPNLS